jgi:hypothetical protein
MLLPSASVRKKIRTKRYRLFKYVICTTIILSSQIIHQEMHLTL